MQKISLAEAHDYGLTIADLRVLTIPRHDECYSDPDPQETIRRIAITQDLRALTHTRLWLRARLCDRRPCRKYNPDLDRIVERTLIRFYAGDAMSYFTSAAQAHEFAQLDAEKRLQMANVTDDIVAELAGMSYTEYPAFLREAVLPKYREGWTDEEIARIILDAVKVHAQHPELLASLQGVSGETIAKDFLGVLELAPTAEYLMQVASLPFISIANLRPDEPPIAPEDTPRDPVPAALTPGEQPGTVQAVSGVRQEDPVSDLPWEPHLKTFTTPKGLKVGLVRKTPRGELLLEIGPAASPTCDRFVVQGPNWIGTTDHERIVKLLGSEANAKLMLAFIHQQFKD